MSSENHYSQYFASEAAASDYVKKFESSVDVMRHEIELQLISKHAHGALFDCSIATGRLVGLLKKVASYSGMDYSEPFLSYIHANFPEVEAQWGDLTKNIQKPDGAYDTVLCLRTLFALGDVDKILAEMVRITKSSGTIIFDYGLKAHDVNFGGALVHTSKFDIETLLKKLPVTLVDTIPLDSPIIKLKNVRIARKLISIVAKSKTLFKWIVRIEQRAASIYAERHLYILRKNG